MSEVKFDAGPLIEAGATLLGGIMGIIRTGSESEEIAQRHIDDLFVRLDQTRAEVHAEAEETKRIAEEISDAKPTAPGAG
jgi:hypothetical protein